MGKRWRAEQRRRGERVGAQEPKPLSKRTRDRVRREKLKLSRGEALLRLAGEE